MKKKIRSCIVCGNKIENNKTKIGQYCKKHDPTKAWDRLDKRFRTYNSKILQKAEAIHFNFHYEINQLKKLICKTDDCKEAELSFFIEKVDNIYKTLEDFMDELKKMKR